MVIRRRQASEATTLLLHKGPTREQPCTIWVWHGIANSWPGRQGGRPTVIASEQEDSLAIRDRRCTLPRYSEAACAVRSGPT
jgi:hypothetical protein